jgi:hypothetical protein
MPPLFIDNLNSVIIGYDLYQGIGKGIIINNYIEKHLAKGLISV